MADDVALTQGQSAALFDILTHNETYEEIQDFKYPGAIHKYGPPFRTDVSASTSPILQSLLSKFILTLPGLRDVSSQFWNGRVDCLVEELAEADLSESYDKGALGIRKTLATAIAALIEYPARGSLGGFPRRDVDLSRQYDDSNPEDVLQSWQDTLQRTVYADLIDVEFKKMAETQNLSDHMSLIQAVHEFIVVNLASLMHYTLVLSPEGPTLIRMMDSVHKLIPYMIIRQTLKIGNVASMISAMVRVVLAKVSVASMTNWIGLSSGADEGKNLLQQIIDQVLWWDRRELKKRADKIERDKHAPPKDVREELKAWIERDRAEHEECRRQSQAQSISIVRAVLQTSSVSSHMTDAQHANALQYLSLHLAIRDRNEIVRVLCKRNPDLLTSAVKEGVDAYTPMIRQVHEAVNLADSFWDLEQFITDMLRISKPTGPKGSEKPPTVEAFVDLLHRHAHNFHKFLHQVAKNGEELTASFLAWTKACAAQFRADEQPPGSDSMIPAGTACGGLDQVMRDAFAELSQSEREAVRKELDDHAKYIDDIHEASAARISAVIRRTRQTPFGPGAYLARWQQHMDSTTITPATAKGPVRLGSSSTVKEEGRKDVDGQEALSSEHAAEAIGELPSMPTAETTLRVLRPKFRAALAGV